MSVNRRLTHQLTTSTDSNKVKPRKELIMLIALPDFVLKYFLDVDFAEMHIHVAVGGAFFFGLTGIMLLMLYVPNHNSDSESIREEAHSKISSGVRLLILAAISLAVGLYLWIPISLGFSAYILWTIVKGINTAFFKG